MTASLLERKPFSSVKEKKASGLPEALAGWEFTCTGAGWFVWQRLFSAPIAREPLAMHCDWSGPVKLVERSGVIEQRIELFPGSHPQGHEQLWQDEETARESEGLFREFLQTNCFADPAVKDPGWQAPAADVLAGWLTDVGQEVAIDRDQNLRLTLKRKGCDGQVRVERSAGTLRLILPLGRWPELDGISHQAMLHLAHAANVRSRLVRIAWIAEEGGERCEAQVDLSGLPDAGNLEPCRQRLWREMVRLGVAGLELVLRCLGLELPLLAEPQNRELAELLISMNCRG